MEDSSWSILTREDPMAKCVFVKDIQHGSQVKCQSINTCKLLVCA